MPNEYNNRDSNKNVSWTMNNYLVTIFLMRADALIPLTNTRLWFQDSSFFYYVSPYMLLRRVFNYIQMNIYLFIYLFYFQISGKILIFFWKSLLLHFSCSKVLLTLHLDLNIKHIKQLPTWRGYSVQTTSSQL